MTFDAESGYWSADFYQEGDLSAYTRVVVTLEPNDGDPAPATPILVGDVATEEAEEETDGVTHSMVRLDVESRHSQI